MSSFPTILSPKALWIVTEEKVIIGRDHLPFTIVDLSVACLSEYF